MENLVFPTKGKWVQGQASQEKEEEQLSQEEYQKELSVIAESLNKLNSDVESLYDRTKRKELSDVMIGLHTSYESLT